MSSFFQQRTIGTRSADWSDAVSLDQIDPASGIVSIALDVVATLSSTAVVHSLEQASSRFSSRDTGSVALERPDGSGFLTATPSTDVSTVLPAATGLAAPDFVLQASGLADATATYVAGRPGAADAAFLVGTGTGTLPVVATARVAARAPGNFGAVFSSEVGATVSMTAMVGGAVSGGLSGGTSSVVSVAGIGALSIGSITTPWQHAEIAPAVTGWSQALGIAGFDPSLGRLERVNITITTDAVGGLQAESLEPEDASLGVMQTARIDLVASGAVLDSQAALIITNRTLSAFDGTIDDAGASGETLSGQTARSTGEAGLYDAASLAAFTGAAAGGVTVSGVGQTAIDGPGALSISGALTAGAVIDVSYSYAPAVGALFDASYYLGHNPDVAAAGVDPYQHYLNFGWKEGRNPSASFNTREYLEQYPDVAASGMNPLLHYALFGQGEGRATTLSPLFDAAYYLAQNPDVAAAGADPYQHYATFGWKEGRNPGGFFDTHYYLQQNPDVAAAGVDPLWHYTTFGWREGRDPSLVFSYAKYLAAAPGAVAPGAVANGGGVSQPQLSIGPGTVTQASPQFLTGGAAPADPLVDTGYYDRQLGATLLPAGTAGREQAAWSYAAVGWQKGLDPDAWFDTDYYLSHNPDVAAAHVNPLAHYETEGWKEGRDPSAAFSTEKYLAAYMDVREAGMDPLLHYVVFGQAEQRAAFAV